MAAVGAGLYLGDQDRSLP